MVKFVLPYFNAPYLNFKANGVDYVVLRNTHFFMQICARVVDLWPGCKMVTGSARHCPSNCGIEKFNRTIQVKINFLAYTHVCKDVD
jgi:hypothetical protein